MLDAWTVVPLVTFPVHQVNSIIVYCILSLMMCQCHCRVTPRCKKTLSCKQSPGKRTKSIFIILNTPFHSTVNTNDIDFLQYWQCASSTLLSGLVINATVRGVISVAEINTFGKNPDQKKVEVWKVQVVTDPGSYHWLLIKVVLIDGWSKLLTAN